MRAPGVTTEASKEIRELKRKVSELERTIATTPGTGCRQVALSAR